MTLELVKEKYTNTPIIISPKWVLGFHVHMDTFNIVVGVMLKPNVAGKVDQPIAYVPMLLNPTKNNYTTIDGEILTMVYAWTTLLYEQ